MSTGDWFVGIFTYWSMSRLLHWEDYVTFCSIGIESFQRFIAVWGKLFIFSSCSSSPSLVHILAEHITGQLRPSYEPCHMLLDWVFMTFDYSQHVGRHPLTISHGKLPHQGCSRRLDGKRYAYTDLSFGYLEKGVALKHLQQWFTSSVGKNRQVGVSERMYEICISIPKFSDYFHLFWVGLASHTIAMYFLLFQFVKTTLSQAFTSFNLFMLMYKFYLQHLPTC